MAEPSNIYVGRSEAGEMVHMPPKNLVRHGLVLGPTRSGKTGFLISMLTQMIQSQGDLRITYVDVKGEGADQQRQDEVVELTRSVQLSNLGSHA